MNHKVTLYRGIIVPRVKQKEVIHDIENNGLGVDGPGTVVKLKDLGNQLNNLFLKDNLSLDDTRNREDKPYTYVTTDKRTAAYYATRSAKVDDASLVIHYEATIDDLVIDGRDFLAPIFQTPVKVDKVRLIKDKLVSMYGEKVLKYYEKAISNPQFSYKLAMHDLATNDKDIIKNHLQNKLVVQGRAKVPVTSVYFAKLPVKPYQITDVSIEQSPTFTYNYHINDLIW